MPRTERTVVSTTQVHPPVGQYSHAVRVKGELVFIAGQVALDVNGDLVGRGDPNAQVRQIFKNIGAILASVGASFENVVEWTTFVAGMESVLPNQRAKVELIESLFPNGGYPASTMVIVEGLAQEEFLVEMRVVAAVP